MIGFMIKRLRRAVPGPKDSVKSEAATASDRPAAATEPQPADVDVHAAGKRFIARSLVLRTLVCLGFLPVMALAGYVVLHDSGGVLNTVIVLCVSALAILYSLDTYLWWRLSNDQLRRIRIQERGSTYTNDLDHLPNTNYLLAELRKEMPRARLNGVPFVLVHFSLESLPVLHERYGDEVGGKAVAALIEMLTKTTRSSDFFAHLGEGRFCSMLNECTRDLAVHYFKRIPRALEIEGAAGEMISMPVTARMYEYDLLAVYATDVVAEVQDADPVPGWEGDAEQRADAPRRTAAAEPATVEAPAAPVVPTRVPAFSARVSLPPGLRLAPQRAVETPAVPAVDPSPARATASSGPISLSTLLNRQRAQAPATGLTTSIIPGPWQRHGRLAEQRSSNGHANAV